MSVSCLGVPLAPAVLARFSAITITVVATVVCAVAFTMMCMVAGGHVGHGTVAFVVLLLAIIKIMLQTGIFFSYAAAALMRHMNPLLASGLLCVGLATGGVACGALAYFSSLSLASNMLVLVIVQLVLMPLVIWGVVSDERRSTTRAARADAAQASAAVAEHDESKPLLAAAEQPPTAVNASPESKAMDEDGQGDLEAGPAAALPPWRQSLAEMAAAPGTYFVAAVVLLKVGIGSSFMTNLGTGIQATLPAATTTQQQADDKAALAVILVNFGQLLGRLGVTTSALAPLRGSANLTTLAVLLLVSLIYMTCMLALLLGPLHLHTFYVVCTIFSVSYGAMWSTTAALMPFLPSSVPLPRLFAVIFPFGGVATLVMNLVSGHIYDANTNKGSNACYGRSCYRDTYIMWLSCSAALFLLVGLRLLRPIPGLHPS